VKKPTTRQIAALVGLLMLLFAGTAVVYQNEPRTLAQRDNADGTSTVVVGKPRLCGLMGIEIVLEHRARDGSRTYASVQDLLNSWEEAKFRYENPDGGGLLDPSDGP